MAQTPSFAAGCARPAFRLVPDVPTLILAAQRAVLAGDALRGSAGMAIACGCGSQTSIQRCVVRWPPTLENSVGRSWNIFMATVGGYGDTLPLIPLGVALQQAGHAVTLMCVSFIAGVVYCFGLNPLPVPLGDRGGAGPCTDEGMGGRGSPRPDGGHFHVITADSGGGVRASV